MIVVVSVTRMVLHLGKGMVRLGLEIIIGAATDMLRARLGGHARVTRIIWGQGSRLAWNFALLQRTNFFLRHISAQLILRHNALLVKRVIDSFWISNAMRIRIPTLLLFVNILT